MYTGSFYKIMDEALKFAIESGIIDLSYIQDEYEMNNRKKILEKHKWAISQGKDGYWRTYLPDEKGGRKMVKKNTEKDIEDAVIKYYKLKEEKEKTFIDVYWMWRSVQDKMVSENTVYKYDTDFKRYFEENEFSSIKISDISEDDIKLFMVDKIKKLLLCQKASKTLFGYIRNTILHAMKHKLISENPMQLLAAKEFYKYCIYKKKNAKEQTISTKDIHLLCEKINQDHEKHPEYIPTYAVQLAFFTGMRVGEISALTWDDITEEGIIIDKSEKYNRKTREYYIDRTKNGKERVFPMTSQIKKLLDSVKRAEMRYGFICEFVFANNEGRIHAPVISSCIKNKCRQIGIEERGIHACRKTLNSRMRCDGVSATTAASLLGHSPEVNEQYYTFDVSTMKEKAKIVEKAINVI